MICNSLRRRAVLFAVAGIAPLVLASLSAAAIPDGDHVVRLGRILPNEKDLHVLLAVRKGKIVDQAAIAPRFNRASHPVSLSGLRLGDRKLEGKLTVRVCPDNYVPADGKAIEVSADVEAAWGDGGGMGCYVASVGGQRATGVLVWAREEPVGLDEGYRRLTVRMIGAVHRIFSRKGPNWKYALDMDMTVAMRDGKVTAVQMESIVPDYRRYSAIVRSHDLAVTSTGASGTVTVDMYYGQQSTGKQGPSDRETYTYRVDLTCIAGTVTGHWGATYGQPAIKVAGRRLLGQLQFTSPPDPETSLGWLRLHGAMRNDWPVLLNISLANDGSLNGLAWAPGYNHQPHPLDATGLVRKGNRIAGLVKITLTPDCYKPPEDISLSYRIDATIADAEIRGTFVGSDEGKARKGTITGEVRPKESAHRPVTLDKLEAVTVSLGYCLVSGPMPKKDWQKHKPNYAEVHFALSGGKVTDVQVRNPSGAKVFQAKVVDSNLRIDGDRFLGQVTFDLQSEALKPGRYRYSFEGIVNGDRAGGRWLGWLDGKGIYTKSAKMNARFHPANPAKGG